VADLCRPDHWVRHVRDTVRFAAVMDRLYGLGVGACLEVGPDAALAPLTAESAPAGAETVPVLRRDQPEPVALLTALALLYSRGRPIDWSAAITPGTGLADLPTYAFQRRVYWLDPVAPVPSRRAGPVVAEPSSPDSGDEASAHRDRLVAADSAERTEILLRLLRELAAEVMRLDSPSQVPADVQVTDLGFTSLMAVDLRNRTVAATGLELPATLVYDHPTFEAIAAHVSGLMAGEENA
jgi:polyketide synthase 8